MSDRALPNMMSSESIDAVVGDIPWNAIGREAVFARKRTLDKLGKKERISMAPQNFLWLSYEVQELIFRYFPVRGIEPRSSRTLRIKLIVESVIS